MKKPLRTFSRSYLHSSGGDEVAPVGRGALGGGAAGEGMVIEGGVFLFAMCISLMIVSDIWHIRCILLHVCASLAFLGKRGRQNVCV